MYSSAASPGIQLTKIRQIDSQIILDLNLFYQKNPEEIPKLGLMEQRQNDPDEWSHEVFYPCNCGPKGCRLSDSMVWCYDDRKVDRALTTRFTSQNQHFLRWPGPASQDCFRQDYRHLFPRRIHGYVLRSRTWSKLVDCVEDKAYY